MSYARSITIAPKAMQKSIFSKLEKDFQFKQMIDNNDHILVVYEGRYIPEFDQSKTFTVTIDGRNIGYSVVGNQSLQEYFDVKVELVVGVSLPLSQVSKLTKNAKSHLKKLEKQATETEEDEDEDVYNLRFDLSPEQATIVVEQLNDLANVLEKIAVEYRVATFEGFSGKEIGKFAEKGLYIGPSAYALASWEQQVLRTEIVELVLNGSETLLDGNGIEDFTS